MRLCFPVSRYFDVITYKQTKVLNVKQRVPCCLADTWGRETNFSRNYKLFKWLCINSVLKCTLRCSAAFSQQETGGAVDQADSCQLLYKEVRFPSWSSSCGICGGQIGTGSGSSPSAFFSYLLSFHHRLHLHSSIWGAGGGVGVGVENGPIRGPNPTVT
jgi:hypothetical protein